MYNFLSFNIFLIANFLFLSLLLYSNGLVELIGGLVSNYFVFDTLSFYTIILICFLGAYSLSFNWKVISDSTKVFLAMSLFFSGLCFCVNHSVLFWCIYELSMLPLLFLIFRDSPYSERFLAGWYFTCYLTITSLPLILTILYLSYCNASFLFTEWTPSFSNSSIYIFLAFVFFTKVPLCPFHTWLPIVHAEATSIVSIFLSGYIMKLGILGVYRCSSFIFNDSLYIYLLLCCLFSIFFILVAAGEMDGKRWLAFLSLSHIVVPLLGFFVCEWESINLVFLFCLGHGLSAGLVFGFLWHFYEVSNTRNWVLLKSSLGGSSFMFLFIIGMLSLCSFPPSLQFFCEINILKYSVSSLALIIFWGAYLFLGGLIPLVLCSHVLIRSESFENSTLSSHGSLSYLILLSIWCFFGIFFL